MTTMDLDQDLELMTMVLDLLTTMTTMEQVDLDLDFMTTMDLDQDLEIMTTMVQDLDLELMTTMDQDPDSACESPTQKVMSSIPAEQSLQKRSSVSSFLGLRSSLPGHKHIRCLQCNVKSEVFHQ